MKHLKLFIAIASSAILFSCSGNSSTVSGKGQNSKAASNSSGDSTYNGDNSFSYTIGGRQIAIKDVMHDGDGKNWMALFLNDVKNDAGAGMVKVNVTNEFTQEVFDFSFANSGSSTILHYSPSLSNFANKKSNGATYMSPKSKSYYGDSVVVTITDINTTHVAGKFTGKFLSEDDKPVPLEITDGSFDLLFTKDKP